MIVFSFIWRISYLLQSIIVEINKWYYYDYIIENLAYIILLFATKKGTVIKMEY